MIWSKTKKFVGIGAGVLLTAAGAGAITYKAVKVADGQKQYDDSNGSMGGQLNFKLGHPLGGPQFAGEAATKFATELGKKITADATDPKGPHINYVNLSDQIQGDIVTGIYHTGDGAPTNVGDVQAGLKALLKGIAGQQAAALIDAGAKDHEIADLRASDIRSILENTISQERKTKLGLTGDDSVEKIIENIKSATVISLNVGMADIFETAANLVPSLKGNTFTQLATPDQNNKFPKLLQLVGALQSVMADTSKMPDGDQKTEILKKQEIFNKAALNMAGKLNGAISTIRRLNPTVVLAVPLLHMMPGQDNPMNALPDKMNPVLQMLSLSHDVKSGRVLVAPVPTTADGTGDMTKPHNVIYATVSSDAGYQGVAAELQKMIHDMMAAAAQGGGTQGGGGSQPSQP